MGAVARVVAGMLGVSALARGATRVTRRSLLGSTVVLIVVNLLPLAAVVAGWATAGTVLVAYWLETVVIGLLNVVRITTAQGTGDPDTKLRLTINGRRPDITSSVALATFFSFHFGMFTLVHGVFTFVLIATPAGPSGVSVGWVATVAAVLAASHLWSLWRHWFGRNEFRRVSPAAAMFAPYGRVILMHLVVLGGAFLVTQWDSGAQWSAVALVVAKLVMDLRGHLREHLKWSRDGQPVDGSVDGEPASTGRLRARSAWAGPSSREALPPPAPDLRDDAFD